MNGERIVKRVRPGDEVLTYCGRCHQERTHQVVALNSQGQADRVICRFCQSLHQYRSGKTGRKNSSAAKDGSYQRETRGTSRSDAAQLKPYSVKEVYGAGDLILHPKFGQGRVIEARSGKIEVRFGASEMRTLLHAG